MRCKTKLTMLMVGLVMAMPAISWAAHMGGNSFHPSWPTVAAEDVRNTLHNLSTSNPIAGVNIGTGSSSTAEVCVFCHTPHGANTSAPGSAPLWNRAIPSSAGYTMYDAPNMDATIGAAPVGVSLACLSCHDGTLALDSMNNTPGSGTDSTLDFIDDVGGFLGDGPDSDSMSETARGDGPNYGILTGATPFPNLTQNLGDDHPISFAMPASSVDPQFSVTKTTSGNLKIITRGSESYADKRDAIRLYPASGNNSPAGDWVECASCHNPHTPRPLFLRLPSAAGVGAGSPITNGTAIPASFGGGGIWANNPNSASAVCISCHEK